MRVDLTVIIAILSSVMALLLFAALVGVVLVGTVVVMRARRWRRRLEARSKELDFEEPVETFAPKGAAADPLAPSAMPLLGFFDDEVSSSGPMEETAKTELFQREKFAEYWDDDEGLEEENATEIFSAHGVAGDLAEFVFDDHDDSTGRFSR